MLLLTIRRRNYVLIYIPRIPPVMGLAITIMGYAYESTALTQRINTDLSPEPRPG